MSDLTDQELEGVEYLLKNASDDEICKSADQGDPAADHIFHAVWDQAKRKEVTARVDKQWSEDFDKKEN